PGACGAQAPRTSPVSRSATSQEVALNTLGSGGDPGATTRPSVPRLSPPMIGRPGGRVGIGEGDIGGRATLTMGHGWKGAATDREAVVDCAGAAIVTTAGTAVAAVIATDKRNRVENAWAGVTSGKVSGPRGQRWPTAGESPGRWPRQVLADRCQVIRPIAALRRARSRRRRS